jgi:hypothetical protein
MTEPQTITPDHVRTLLAADDGAASLVLIEGRVEVLAADRLGTDEYLGAFEVASRDELTERLGADPSDDDIATEAAGLSASVQQIGG